jgi:hypothetical protein
MGILKDILDTAHDLGVETNAEEYLRESTLQSLREQLKVHYNSLFWYLDHWM